MPLPKLNELKENGKNPKGYKVDTGEVIPIKKRAKKRSKRASLEEVEAEADDDLLGKSKTELINILLNENKDIPIENILMDVIKTGKVTSSLKGIRETLEDVMNIEQLIDLIKIMRHKSREPPKSNNQDSNQSDMEDSAYMTMLPFLSKMSNNGFDISKIDPMMLLMANMSQSQGNNGLGKLFFMMSMANLLSQNSNNNQVTTQNGEKVIVSDSGQKITPDILKSMYEEMKNIMSEQPKPAVDPNLLLMIKMLDSGRAQQQNNEPSRTELMIEKMLMKFDQMMQNKQTEQLSLILNSQTEKFERALNEIASYLRQDPKQEILSTFDLFKAIQGNAIKRTSEELKHERELKKLELEEKRRRDLLRLQQLEKDREFEKSQSLVNTAKEIIGSIVGESAGQFVKDVISASRAGKNNNIGNINNPELKLSTADFED